MCIRDSNDGDQGDSEDFNGSSASLGKAGIVVLNTGNTTINNNFEGYYVGISDQSNVNPTTDFDAVQQVYTTTTTNGDIDPESDYVVVPKQRLGFTLSATGGTQASYSKSSISRTLETFSKFDIDGAEFIDTINIGVFKVRNTPFGNSDLELTNFLAEGYTGSLNSFRKIQNENGGSQKSFFIGDVENNSPNIKVLVNPNISTNSGTWTSTSGDVPTKFVRTLKTSGTANAAILGAFAGEGKAALGKNYDFGSTGTCLLYTSPSQRDKA